MTILRFQVVRIWCLACLFAPALGQTSELFQWQFANSAIATSLPTCATLPIVVKSFHPVANITQGTPPYYMIAFAVGGTPQTSYIGTDENNLNWTVTHPVGSKLALSVVDANGSAGGISPQFFQVMAGQSTQCVVTPPTSPAFTVTANVTTDLTTCQPWGLTVKGGVPPYNVTLLQLGSPNVTNVTMPNGLDVFTYIDRATPGLDLIAGVSDLSMGIWNAVRPSPRGVYYQFSIVVMLTQCNLHLGSSFDPSVDPCVGLVSQSGNSSQILQEEEAAAAVVTAEKRRHSAVVAVMVVLLFLILGGLAFASFLYLRKQRREVQAELAETKPDQYVEIQKQSPPDDQIGSSEQPVSRKAAILAEINAARSNARGSPSPPETTLTSDAQVYSRLGLDRSTSANATLSSSNQTSNPGFVTFPTTSIRRSGKLVVAEPVMTPPTATRSPESEQSGTGTPDPTSRVGGEVFQHRDGGVVRELPPPYAVRRSRRASS